MAAFTFETYDEDSWQSLVSAADVAFSGYASDFSADFKANLNQITSSTRVSWHFHPKALGFSTSNLPTSDNIVNFVLTFATVDLDGLAVIDFMTLSYHHKVHSYPTGFAQIGSYQSQPV